MFLRWCTEVKIIKYACEVLNSELAIKLKEMLLESSLVVSEVSSSVCSIGQKSQHSARYPQDGYWEEARGCHFASEALVNPHGIVRQDHRIIQVDISNTVCSSGLHISRKIMGLEEAQKRVGEAT